MTKKDYELIATAISCGLPLTYKKETPISEMSDTTYGRIIAVDRIITKFTELESRNNPRFDESKFIEAVGI